MFNVPEHNFIKSGQRGEILPNDIDDFIDDWHDHDYAMETRPKVNLRSRRKTFGLVR